MKECPLRLDTPAPILADWLNEYGWTFADLECWYFNLMLAFLEAGGWQTVPDGEVLDDWELLLLADRQQGRQGLKLRLRRAIYPPGRQAGCPSCPWPC